MKFVNFLKEKVLVNSIFIVISAFSAFLLLLLGVDAYAIIFLGIVNVSAYIIVFVHEFNKKATYYNMIEMQLKNLDKPYLLSELINEPDFIEGILLYKILRKTNKSMNDEIAKYKYSSNEYREYIEMWVHEIKAPISSSKLVIENNRNKVTKSIEEEVNKMDALVEQVLFYTKINSVEKDYIIKKISLKKTINNVIKKNAKLFIQKQIAIDVNNVDYIIYSDIKWVEFIINQIFTNSIKYMEKKHKILEIEAEEKRNQVVLSIKDNGIGMSEKDVQKAFEKGYTGDIGRNFSNSTGFGLYLCKKLCTKLGIDIQIESAISEGTIIYIIFPKSKMNIFSDS